MTILALDLGTTTGWAVIYSDGSRVSGTICFKPQKHEGGGMRFIRFRRWLEETIAAIKPDALYYEAVRRHAGTDAAHIYGGLLAVVTALCDGRDPMLPYAGVPVATIKRHATGKGVADKAAMIQAARDLGFAPADDNEADAIMLADYAVTRLGGGHA